MAAPISRATTGGGILSSSTDERVAAPQRLTT
jgi:hypothetical protein